MFWMKPFRRTRRAPDQGLRPPMRSEFAPRDHRGDPFVERYVDWLEECEALEHAYRRWAGCRGAERDLAFAMYSEALDREERAASRYGVVAARERARSCP